MLLALLAGFAVLPRPTAALTWVPAILYTIAIAADLLDEARWPGSPAALPCWAQRWTWSSIAWACWLAVTLAVRYGQLPWPYLLVGLARYLFVFGLWWLSAAGSSNARSDPSTFRRIQPHLQMAFISVILWPLFTRPPTLVAGVCFGVPFLAGFTRDWLVVSGAVDPALTGYRRVMGWYAWIKQWLPPALRLGAAALAVGVLGPLVWSVSPLAPYRVLGFPGTCWRAGPGSWRW